MTDARIEAAAAFLRECGAGDDALDLATGALAAADAAEESELAATRSALRQLTDEEPVVYNSDRGYTTCAYCADYYEDDDHHNDKPHSSDCPWLAARVLVSDVSTQETNDVD